MKETKQKVSVSVIPFEDHILGADDQFIFIKTFMMNENDEDDDCVVKTSRKEYLRILNLWIDAKADYCKRWNHFCGVQGQVSTDDGEQIGEIDILDEDSIDDEKVPQYKDVPLIMVKKFEDTVDMEHG